MTQKEFAQRLTRRAKRAGVILAPPTLDKLRVYFELLFRWNAKINLTSLTLDAPDEAIDRLLIEPLLAAHHIEGDTPRLIDIGSGGGSPAIPLLLAKPGLRLVMVESKARKSAFLREALRHLDATGVVEAARFEELLSRAEFHEAFDYLSIRAVRTEPRTLNTLQAFVRPGGRLLLFRSEGRRMESADVVPPLRFANAAPLLKGCEIQLLEKLRIP